MRAGKLTLGLLLLAFLNARMVSIHSIFAQTSEAPSSTLEAAPVSEIEAAPASIPEKAVATSGQVVAPKKPSIQKLTDQDRTILATARDFTPELDNAAWYPLLANVEAWPFGQYPMGAGYNRELLLSQPEEERGRIFIVKGQYPRAVRRIDGELRIDNENAPVDWSRFSRSGPWEGRTQRWDVITNPEEEDPNKHEVASLIVLNPLPIVSGDQVEFVGYFYKVARQSDSAGRSTDYPVFVGQVKSIEKAGYVQGAKQLKQTVNPGNFFFSFAIVVLVFVFIFIKFKMGSKKNKTTSVRQMRLQRREQEKMGRQNDDEDEAEEAEEKLPENPVDALAALEAKRQEEEGEDEGEGGDEGKDGGDVSSDDATDDHGEDED